jgi:hypothetical protein
VGSNPITRSDPGTLATLPGFISAHSVDFYRLVSKYYPGKRVTFNSFYIGEATHCFSQTITLIIGELNAQHSLN